VRIPLFRYLSNKPIRSDFLNNFQVITFGDIGTAWNGKSPYDDSNSLNTLYIGAQGNPITVILKNQRDPIIGGYGFGLRSRILGYFVRADWAWGVENGKVLPKNGNPDNKNKPTMFYLSFCLDF
jgi:hemolysin activation/secretion protein